MSYTYHGTSDLIALPNRTVQTFPSGLVRVERSFVCRKDQVARYRNTIKVNEPMPFDNGAPAIDGLYIFPEPQEVVRDDGFVEFRVTAYGRTNTRGNIDIRINLDVMFFLYASNFETIFGPILPSLILRTINGMTYIEYNGIEVINESTIVQQAIPRSEPFSFGPEANFEARISLPDGSALTPEFLTQKMIEQLIAFTRTARDSATAASIQNQLLAGNLPNGRILSTNRIDGFFSNSFGQFREITYENPRSIFYLNNGIAQKFFDIYNSL